MKIHSTLSLGTLAVAANAFLVPLEASDSDVANALFTAPQEAQDVTLDCSTCPYALKSERNGHHEWTNGVPNDLLISFDTEDNAIRANGVPFFPVVAGGMPPVLTAPQIKKDEVETSMVGYDGVLTLSYGLEMVEKKSMDGESLVELTMSVMGLEGEMIRVDDILVKIIKLQDDKVVLHSITLIPTSSSDPDAECTNIGCRVFTKIMAAVARVKSASKMAANKMKHSCSKCLNCILRMMGHKGSHNHHEGDAKGPALLPDGTVVLPTHHHFKPPGMQADGRPHAHHAYDWHNSSFLGRMRHILWITMKIAVIPILIGVFFGVAASAIGMLVGQTVVFLWMKYRKSESSPAYERLSADEKEEVPPPYEDTPTAEALTEKEAEIEA